jgi:hypothetical protein
MDFYNPQIPEQLRQQALEAGIEPAVYTFVQTLGQTGVEAMVCPVCGAKDWQVFPHRMDAHFTEVPARVDPADLTFPLALVVCRRCRFVRLHYLGSL